MTGQERMELPVFERDFRSHADSSYTRAVFTIVSYALRRVKLLPATCFDVNQSRRCSIDAF